MFEHASLNTEGDGSKVIKENRFEGSRVNCDQAQGLMGAQRCEKFAIFKGDIELKSLFALVPARVSLQCLCVNFGGRRCLFRS